MWTMDQNDALWHIPLPVELVFAILSFILPSIQMRTMRMHRSHDDRSFIPAPAQRSPDHAECCSSERQGNSTTLPRWRSSPGCSFFCSSPLFPQSKWYVTSSDM